MLMKMRSKMQKNNNQKGFTLVELMVVVVILGVLVAIAVPIYNNVSDTAKQNAEAANIRILEGAISAYLADNGGGSYEATTMDADGTIGGTGIVAGELVPDFLKDFPESPYGSSVTYTKNADGEVVSSYGTEEEEG